MISIAKVTATLTLSITLLSVLNAQNAKLSLADLYARMKSSDPKIRSQAQEDAPGVLQVIFPNIEEQTLTIAAGLHDSDPYIRLQSSAILSVVARSGPGHAGLLSACTPDLQGAVTDENPRVRINSLQALASIDGGTPASATPFILRAMEMPDGDTKAFSTLALLKLHNVPNDVNQTIATLIQGSKDPLIKKQMLRAVYTVGPVPKVVADSFFDLTNDSDPEVQVLATQTVARMYADKVVAERKLQETVVRGQAVPNAASKEAIRQIEQLHVASQ